MSLQDRPDICLILEGTYPFVTGGVSSWIHRLVSRMPEVTFTILHLSPDANAYPEGPRYELPDNVVGVKEVYIHPESSVDRLHEVRGARWKQVIAEFAAMMEDLRNGSSGAFETFFDAVNSQEDLSELQLALLSSPEGWEVMIKTYEAEAGKEGLLRFVWSWRFALLPLINVLSSEVPEAGAYHTVCTGYAGILAAGAKLRWNRPMLLTEHGIYTKERRIDIQRADWIPEAAGGPKMSEREAPYFRRFWIRQFEMMARVCYDNCDEIYTLYEGNKALEVKDGADPARIEVIPNGINLARFQVPDEEPDPNRPYTVGFIGRVCPIKDVRTLIRASRLLADAVPNVKVRVMGPWNEDPEYAQGCRDMATALHLDDVISFDGPVNVVQELPTIDVAVLSSISEAQPLVLLEAGAMGIPTVATDVGSCSELLFGRIPEDKALGEGGLIVPIATPGALAKALITLAEDPERRRAMGRTMRQRVEKFYDEDDMVASYEAIYRRLARGAGPKHGGSVRAMARSL